MAAMPPNQPPTPAPAAADVVRGLPMVKPKDAEALAREKGDLAALARRPTLARWRGYARRTGPGWIQSAITLGAGTAASSLTIGAFFQYELLWVQIVAMLLGVVMFAAIAHQTLLTGARPFGAMKAYVAPSVAWAWAGATLLATLIWHFPQYALAAGMTEDMIKAVSGWQPDPGQRTGLLLAIGGAVLAVSTAVTWSYGSGRRGIRLYERALKAMVWAIIVAFALVILRSTIAGKVEWGKVLRGFLPLSLPRDPRGIETVMGALGAAVGINMTFLFPYSLLARGWGKEHLGLARFDLVTGMLLPFIVATSLMIIAAGCTIFQEVEFLRPGDVPKDAWPALCRRLVEGERAESLPLQRRVWDLLTPKTRGAAARIAARGAGTEADEALLREDLNRLIALRDLARPEDVAGLQAGGEAAYYLRRDRAALSAKEARLLNRALLVAACKAPDPATGRTRATIPGLGQLPPARAARMLEAAGVGTFVARIIFGLGILGMALSSITTHMIVAGFAACEMFGIEPKGWKYKLTCLIPVPGVLGVVLWQTMGFWVAVRTSAICGLLLPIAYIAFFVLQNSRRYLGPDRPRGLKALLWNAAMLLAIAAPLASSLYYIANRWRDILTFRT